MKDVLILNRLVRFLALVLVLTALMCAAWILSRALLPQQVLRAYFARLFAARVQEFTFWRILLANLFPFLGIQFMNLFRVARRPGGIYALPIFWRMYSSSLITGIIYGTNSLVYASQPIALSVSVLWQRTGFTELLAYTLGYEASRRWQLWDQPGAWGTRRLPGARWQPSIGDACYWLAGAGALIFAAWREVA